MGLDPEQTQQAVERHEAVLVTNEAGELHTLDELPAPMTAVLRIDADLLQLADRLDDLAEQLGR